MGGETEHPLPYAVATVCRASLHDTQNEHASVVPTRRGLRQGRAATKAASGVGTISVLHPCTAAGLIVHSDSKTLTVMMVGIVRFLHRFLRPESFSLGTPLLVLPSLAHTCITLYRRCADDDTDNQMICLLGTATLASDYTCPFTLSGTKPLKIRLA